MNYNLNRRGSKPNKNIKKNACRDVVAAEQKDLAIAVHHIPLHCKQFQNKTNE